MFTSHRGHVSESHYDILEYTYVGGDDPPCGGYMHVIEIKNPPEGRCGFIIHEFLQHAESHERHFAEWQSLAEAIAAFEKCWSWRGFAGFPEMPGFLRTVECGQQKPWFFAKPDEYAPGDYVALPGHLF